MARTILKKGRSVKSPIVPGFDHIVQSHRPAGYEIKKRKLNAVNGETKFVRRINLNKDLSPRNMLFVLLHEFGHVHMRHLTRDGHVTDGLWQDEYEADQYAIKAMRHAGVPIPKDILAQHKLLVRDRVEAAPNGAIISKEVLRYAYGRNWKKYHP